MGFMTPEQLAYQLNVSGKEIRRVLRAKYPRPPWERGARWTLPPEVVSEVINEVRNLSYRIDPTRNKILPRPPRLPGISFERRALKLPGF